MQLTLLTRVLTCYSNLNKYLRRIRQQETGQREVRYVSREVADGRDRSVQSTE